MPTAFQLRGTTKPPISRENAIKDPPRYLRTAEVRHGSSREQLPAVAGARIPTFYWLDGHWCARGRGLPAGVEDQCPVLDELSAIAGSHPSDCVVIDDAVYFATSPSPPYRADCWPTLIELLDAMTAAFPQHHVTVIHSYVIAVPAEGKPSVDDFGHRVKLWQRALGRVRGWTKR